MYSSVDTNAGNSCSTSCAMNPACFVSVSSSVFQLYATGVSVSTFCSVVPEEMILLLRVNGVLSDMRVMFFLRLMSELHESAVAVGLIVHVPELLVKPATAPDVAPMLTWRA